MEYAVKKLSFNEFLNYEFEDNTVYDYEIIYKNVPFSFLINIKKTSNQVVAFGTGDINREKNKLPVYNRHSWKDEFDCTTIFYSDPTLLLNDKVGLCWCYGVNEHWYLESIAFLILEIIKKVGSEVNDSVFFGSSAGGYTSLLLASMLHAKAAVINPQLIIPNFWERIFDNFKSTVLKKDEELLEGRISALALFNREGYFPKIFCKQNIYAEHDISTQIIPFFDEYKKYNLNLNDNIFDLSFYYDENGHSGMPSKEQTINFIIKALEYKIKNNNIYPENSFLSKYYKGEFYDDSHRKLYIFITVDTEDKYGEIPYLFECDFGDKGSCGVNYIMDELEKRDMHGVFFTNIYEHNNFHNEYENYMEKLVKRISQRGHEVGLHDHKNVKIYRETYLNYESVSDIISYGTDFIKRHTGKEPVSYRGGAYRCSDVLLKVLSDKSYKVDASYYVTHPINGGRNINTVYHSFNQVTKIENLLEFPIINCFNDKGQLKKFDINWLDYKELVDITEQMKKRDGFNAASLIFHSFSFIDQKGSDNQEPVFVCGNHKAYGISKPLMKRFEDFLDYLYNDPDIEVVTYEEYLKLNLPLPSFWNDGIFCTSTDISKKAAKEFKSERYNKRSEIKSPFFEATDVYRNINYADCVFENFKIYYPEKDIINISNDILDGKLHVYPRIGSLKYNLNDFDFNTKFSNIPNTFQLYLQSLTPVAVLTKAFEITKNIKYLKYAFEFLKRWFAYSKNIDNYINNKYVFIDHSVALRVENLLYFGKICNENCIFAAEIFDLLYDVFSSHGEWLVDDKNYTQAHNHGIMQDEALLHIGYLLNRNEYKEKAKQRLVEQEKSAFTDEYVHTENSPGYASLVSSLFRSIGKFLVNNGDDFGKLLIEHMNQNSDYLNWTIMPNGLMARIGDTNVSKSADYGNEEQMRRKNDKKYSIYPVSGYYYYRSDWSENVKEDTWKMVKSGYSKTAHKHADDLSFMIYSKGYEIFTDCGIYGYNNDDFRKFFVSALAHNTIIVDDISYECNTDNINKCGISSFDVNESYQQVRLYNNSYKGVSIIRDFYSAGDLTVLFDKICSNDIHLYSQLFHLGKNISLDSFSNDEVVIKIADTDYRVFIKQLKVSPKLSIFNGDINKANFGLISRCENHKDTITTLKYDTNGKTADFITVIAIVDEQNRINLGNQCVSLDDMVCENDTISFKNTPLRISRNNIETCEKEIDSDLIVSSVDYEVHDNQLICRLNINKDYANNCEFAYYLMCENDTIDKVMYKPNTEHTFTITKSGSYRLKYFIKINNFKKSYLAKTIKIQMH